MTEIALKELKDILEDNELDLSARNLEVVPKALSQLSKATVIDLSQNKLTSLPQELCSMTRIVKLDLGTNRLAVLPYDFGNLVNLQHLNLYNNEIESLPLSFAKLRSLKWLDLGRNELEPALQKAAGNCSNDKECKQAAVNVVDFMKRKQLEVQQAVHQQEQMNQKIHAENLAVQKNLNQKKNPKKQPKKDIPQLHQEPKTGKIPDSKPKKPPMAESNSKAAVGNGNRGVFGFIFCLLKFLIRWSLIVGAALVLCASIALFLDCYKAGGQIPNSKSFCTDLKKLTNFKAPSDKFIQHAKNAYGTVFNSYYTQFNQTTTNARKTFNQFYKTSTFMKDAEKFMYKCHKVVTHYAFYVFTQIGDAYTNLLKWYDTEGKKTIGFIVEPIQIAAQMSFEFAKDIAFIAFDIVSNFVTRSTVFFERIFTIWAEKGFSAAIDAALQH